MRMKKISSKFIEPLSSVKLTDQLTERKRVLGGTTTTGGVVLSRIEGVSLEVDDDDEALVRLHEILYGHSGVKSSRKLKILKWGGALDDGMKSRIKAAISMTTLGTVLKEICVLLGIDIGENRDKIESDIYHFLISPKSILIDQEKKIQINDDDDYATLDDMAVV